MWSEMNCAPQLMRAYRSIPYSAIRETANLMMLGREFRLLEQLQGYFHLLMLNPYMHMSSTPKMGWN